MTNHPLFTYNPAASTSLIHRPHGLIAVVLVISVAGIGKYRCEEVLQAELSVKYWPLENRLNAGSRGCSEGDGEYLRSIWTGFASRVPRRATARSESW